MKRALAVTLALCPVSGCATGEDEFAEAPPAAEQVTIDVPATTTSAGAGDHASALLGQPSEFYEITYGVSTAVNGTTIELLTLLRTIAHLPATSKTNDSRTWGPFTPGGLDPLTYRATVTKIAPKQFTFAIDARPRASSSDGDFLPLLDGMVTKEAPNVGQGTLTLHFDNRRALRPDTCEEGTVAIAFNNTQPDATIDVMFEKFANNNASNVLCKNEDPHDATYHYDRTADGAGNFVFTVQTNVNAPEDNKPALENVSMRSRWRADGAGRSDVIVSGGDVASDLATQGFSQTSVTVAQCWNTGFQTVYEAASPIALFPPAGSESDCAFTSAMLPQ